MKRKTFSNDFKAKVAIESELASEYGIHPTQINSWKKCSVQNYHHKISQIIDHNIWQKSHEITTLWS